MKLVSSIAIPASFASYPRSLRERTVKVGFIGRASAIFGVENIFIYKDRPDVKRSEALIVADILNYMNCPQYLRKYLYPLKPYLRYVGILPPLRSPHHPLKLKGEQLPPLSYREGVVTSRLKDGSSLVEVGLDKPVVVQKVKLNKKRPVILRLERNGCELKAQPVDRSEVPYYFGYEAKVLWRPLGELVKSLSPDLTIATSKYGVDLKEVIKPLRARIKSARSMLVLFGSPTEGLRDILKREGLKVEEVADFNVNFAPGQSTETIRTEEAVFIVLSVLNLLKHTDVS
ncbi:MAG: RNA methyltransferase [Candidatus Nezhaarchaeales archaeon]